MLIERIDKRKYTLCFETGTVKRKKIKTKINMKSLKSVFNTINYIFRYLTPIIRLVMQPPPKSFI